jgi:hypothetical protein
MLLRVVYAAAIWGASAIPNRLVLCLRINAGLEGKPENSEDGLLLNSLYGLF